MGIFGVVIVAWLGAIIWNKKIEETLPQAVLGTALLIYLFGLINKLSWGVNASFMIITVAMVGCLVFLFKDKTRTLSSIFTYGAGAYIVYILFFLIYSSGRDFNHTDVLSTWGLMAKRFYYNHGGLYSDVSAGYPPLIPIWNYFSAKTWVGFSDTICIFGQSVMVLALLMPVFSGLEPGKNYGTVKASFLLFMMPVIMVLSGMPGYDRALADGMIAAIICFFIYSLLNYLNNFENFHLISMIIAAAALCLTKRIGFIIACMMLFIAFYAMLGKRDKIFTKGNCIMVTIVLLAIFSWHHLSIFVLVPLFSLIAAGLLHHMTVKFSGKNIKVVYIFILTGLAFLLVAVGSEVCIKNDIAVPIGRLLNKILYFDFSCGYIHVPYVLFIALLIGTYIWSVINNSFIVDQRVMLGVIISMAAYGIMMCGIYVFAIYPLKSSIEGITPRYMIPWEIMIVYVLLFVVVSDANKEVVKHLLALCCVILLLSDTGTFLESIALKHERPDYDAFEKCGIELGEADKIYYIDEECESSESYLEFYYSVFPATSNFKEALSDGFEFDVSEERLKADISDGYNYVYIHSFEKDFPKRCGKMFENKKEISPKTVYRVESSGDNIKLIRVERIR